MEPPKRVLTAGVSPIKYQTQSGPKENSNNINNVISAASKCLVAIINIEWAKPLSNPPQMNDKIRSLFDICI